MTDTNRYLISTLETFIAGFLATFLLQLETMLNTGTITKELLISAFTAGCFAGIKVVIKFIRESYLLTK